MQPQHPPPAHHPTTSSAQKPSASRSRSRPSPLEQQTSRFVGSPPPSPRRVPLPPSPALVQSYNGIESMGVAPGKMSGSRRGGVVLASGKSSTRLAGAGGKKVTWETKATGGAGVQSKSLFRRVSQLGESGAERDARVAERRKNGSMATEGRGGRAGSGGPSAGRSSTSARNALGAPLPPPVGFVPFAGPPFPFYGAPFPLPLFPAPLYGYPAPPPPPSSSGFTAERTTQFATPPSSPLSDVESMYENQRRRPPPSSADQAPQTPRRPLIEMQMATFTGTFPQPPPSNPRYTPPTPKARQPRRDAPPPRRLQPIRFDSTSTEDGKVLTQSASFDDADSSDYEHEGSSHAWFATTSQPPTPRAVFSFAEGPSSFGPVSSDQLGQGALMEEDEEGEKQPRPLSIASAWERELIDEYMEE